MNFAGDNFILYLLKIKNIETSVDIKFDKCKEYNNLITYRNLAFISGQRLVKDILPMKNRQNFLYKLRMTNFNLGWRLWGFFVKINLLWIFLCVKYLIFVNKSENNYLN